MAIWGGCRTYLRYHGVQDQGFRVVSQLVLLGRMVVLLVPGCNDSSCRFVSKPSLAQS